MATLPLDATRNSLQRNPRKRGGLRLLVDMPLDIVFEIICNLEPMDVLNLARTTKTWRSALMCRSVAFVWKASFKNIPDIPECPSDMSLPQYTHLLFCYICHFCSNGPVRRIVWRYRLRCCRSCWDAHFFGRPPRPANASSAYTDYCEYIFPHKWCLKDDYWSVVHTLERLLSQNGRDSAEFQNYIVSRKARVIETYRCENMYRSWVWSIRNRRTAELNVVREKRKDAILEKLDDLGWSDEVAKLSGHLHWEFYDLELFKRPNDLNDKAWEKMKPRLIQFLETAKAERLDHDYQLLDQRVESVLHLIPVFAVPFANTMILPRPADVCFMDPIREALIDLSDVRFLKLHKALEGLQDLCREWHAHTVQFLLRLCTTSDPDAVGFWTHPDSWKRFYLATTFFRFREKHEFHEVDILLDYPHLLVHDGLTKFQRPYEHTPFQDSPDVDFPACVERNHGLPWNYNGAKVVYDPHVDRCARDVVLACGAAPQTTTIVEMDSAGHWLECIYCVDPQGGSRVMHWRSAVYHRAIGRCAGRDDEHHLGPRSWRLLAPAEASLASHLASVSVHEDEGYVNPSFTPSTCLQCRLQLCDLSSTRNMRPSFVALGPPIIFTEVVFENGLGLTL